MFNPNFDMLEPSAWNALLLSNDFPMRPALTNANTNIEGVDIAGQVASKNKTVKIHKAVKPSGDANVYDGTGYTQDTLSMQEYELKMEEVLYRAFSIDKWDPNFSLPDLVNGFVAPRIQNILDTINKRYIMRELNRFNSAFADLSTGATTVLDTLDVRYMRKLLLERAFIDSNNLAAVVNPSGEFDLNGLASFQADKRGDNFTQLTGAIRNAFGFDFLMDNIPSVVDSTAAVGDATVNGAAAVGDTIITIDSGTTGTPATHTLEDGDVIYFGTSPTREDWYVVDSATPTSITLKEPLRVAVADNAAVSGVDGSAQYFYDPDGIALVTAIPVDSQVKDAPGVARIPFFEPVNRTNFLISIEGGLKGAEITIETLVGSKNFQPSRGGRYIRGDAAKA